jgi:replicative superfamily II helicase
MSHEARVRGGKAIYLAPLRALAKEKIDDWLSEKSLFSDLKISICTGDYRLTEARMKELNEADVIVMTSEMLNSRCRNLQSENNEFLRNCGTLVVDESHLLTVPSRGDHLEVGLMKFSQIARDPRIVFLSATMPNVDQIANWVGCSLVKKDTYLVHSEYRPCPLEIHYDEYETGESYDLTEEYKASSAVDLIKEHKDDKFLVFVHSKATGERIRSALEERGVVCELHNADLDKDKRHKVEQKFKSGDLRVIVATSTLAWGCNFPARRVIIAGVHRGRTEVETYDIFQMAGRAGRPGYDPKGDVHILLPYGESDHHIDRLSTPKNIESQLLSYVGQEEDPRYKTLAFHLVSEIHYGQIKTIKDVHDWYSKSLAYFQYEDLDDSIVDKTIDLLTRVGAIKEVDGNYEATSVGKVSSIMYYSPFDVADLRRNFRTLFSKGLDQSDFALSLALGNVDTIRAGFVARAEKDEMSGFASKVYEAHGSDFPESAIKGAYAYYCLLNGNQLGPFAAFAKGLQMDAERLVSVLNMLDSMAAKWNRRDYFNAAHLRIMYGVRPELIELCKIPNIGKVRAEKLYAAGFRRPPDLFKNPHLVKRLLNMKDEKIQEIMNSIKSIS